MRSHLSLLAISLFFLANCSLNNGNNNPNIEDNERMLGLMEYWYLWNAEIPANIKASDFESPYELLQMAKYSSLDIWSGISDANQFQSYYNEGTYLGYGFSYGWDDDNNLRFRYTYDDGPFGRAGVERGWKLLEIDGRNVQTITDWAGALGPDESGFTQTFLIEDHDGNRTEYEISKGLVTINPVLYSDTFELGTETIGYLVFNNFINPATPQLDQAFMEFQSASIDRLILDMRYNGGGRLSVANYLAEYILQADDVGKPLFKYVHNIDRTEENSSSSLNKNGLLNLDELIVLTTNGTASASELILNGFKPLMNVTHIGVGNTYGKPVGSYSWYSIDESEVYTLISFRFTNSIDEGDFFNGIEPDFTACDNINKGFGDQEESLFAAAIEYLETGSTGGCDAITKSLATKPTLVQEEPAPILIVNQ